MNQNLKSLYYKSYSIIPVVLQALSNPKNISAANAQRSVKGMSHACNSFLHVYNCGQCLRVSRLEYCSMKANVLSSLYSSESFFKGEQYFFKIKGPRYI